MLNFVGGDEGGVVGGPGVVAVAGVVFPGGVFLGRRGVARHKGVGVQRAEPAAFVEDEVDAVEGFDALQFLSPQGDR